MFRFDERCCVFASLVLDAFARVVGFVSLLVWLGCFVSLLFYQVFLCRADAPFLYF